MSEHPTPRTVHRSPGPRLYFSPSSNKVLVFNPGGFFDGWVCEWTAGVGSALRSLGQLREIPVPPDFDIEAAIRGGSPALFAKVDASSAASKPSA
jgi:hypothetical protein